MPIPLPIIIQAAGYIASAYAEQQEARRRNAELMAGFARVLADNNAVLLREMSGIVRQALSEAKLNDCTNKLATLATFYNEYANNLQDQGKLALIEQQCQFVLDTLDDADILLSGVRVYLGVATLRVNALALKAAFQPGDRENAKALARSAISYVAGVRPQLEAAARARFSPLTVQHGGAGNPDTSTYTCTTSTGYRLDGTWIPTGGDYYVRNNVFDFQGEAQNCINYLNTRWRPVAERAYEDRIVQVLSELPFPDIDQCIQHWQNFIAQT